MAHLNLSDFDIGGFSLGARTVAKLLVEGLQPRRARLAGMGLAGLSGWAKRREFFLTAFSSRFTVKRGFPHLFAVQFIKTLYIYPVSASLLLATFCYFVPVFFSFFPSLTLFFFFLFYLVIFSLF